MDTSSTPKPPLTKKKKKIIYLKTTSSSFYLRMEDCSMDFVKSTRDYANAIDFYTEGAQIPWW